MTRQSAAFAPARVCAPFVRAGIDGTHNPEFTTCELYQAHGNYQTMMALTEDLLTGASRERVRMCAARGPNASSHAATPLSA